MRDIYRLAVSLIALVAALANVGAEEFRSDSGRFRFEAPPNWVRFAPFKLDQAKNAAMAPKMIFHEGFEPMGLVPDFDGSTFPFFFVLEVKQPQSKLDTYDKIERSLNNDFRREVEKGGGQNMKIANLVLDRAKNRFSAQFDMTAPNGIRIRGILYVFLGKDSQAMIMCFSKEATFAQNRVAWDAMADTFRYDEGYQFVPFDTARFVWIAGSICGGLCCVATVLIVVIVGAFMVLKKQ